MTTASGLLAGSSLSMGSTAALSSSSGLAAAAKPSAGVEGIDLGPASVGAAKSPSAEPLVSLSEIDQGEQNYARCSGGRADSNSSPTSVTDLGRASDAVFGAGAAAAGPDSLLADLARGRLPQQPTGGMAARQAVDALLQDSAQWLHELPLLGPAEPLRNPDRGGQN